MREVRRAVITGATGVVGTALCKKLLEEQIEVYAVCRPNCQRTSYIPQDVKMHLVECSLSDLYSLSDFIKDDIDVFYHLAWANTFGESRNHMESQISNIRYTLDACHAARKLGCKVFIGAGSQAEYGRVEGTLCPDTPCFPENGYGMAKLCAGQMSRVECKKLEIDHMWTRILSVYGPNDRAETMIIGTIQELLQNKKPALTAGEQQWDFLYASDAADALYRIACRGKDGKIYPVGSGEARPLREYVEILRNQIDPDLPLGFGEIPYSNGQVMHLQADITDLQADTGFIPSVSFEEGIKKTIEYVQKKWEIENK